MEAVEFMKQNQIDDLSALKSQTGFPFWNTSKFTFESLLNDSDNIDSNLEVYLDGFSPNVQEIISKFKLRNQLETMKWTIFIKIIELCNSNTHYTYTIYLFSIIFPSIEYFFKRS